MNQWSKSILVLENVLVNGKMKHFKPLIDHFDNTALQNIDIQPMMSDD